MALKYELVSGTPKGKVTIWCETCSKPLFEVPKGCVVKLENSSLMSNAACFFGNHPVSVKES